MVQYSVPVSGPSPYSFAVTPSDTVNLAQPIRGFYVGVAGNVVLVNSDATTVTWTGCLAGTVYPAGAVRINSTSTTATNIVGLV